MPYVIKPAQFTDSQWEELYNASDIIPRDMEARRNARPLTRSRRLIEAAILECGERAIELTERGEEGTWINDLNTAAATLRRLIGPMRMIDARRRLYDLLTSDIYTDAPEYADRVEEAQDLIATVFKVEAKP